MSWVGAGRAFSEVEKAQNGSRGKRERGKDREPEVVKKRGEEVRAQKDRRSRRFKRRKYEGRRQQRRSEKNKKKAGEQCTLPHAPSLAFSILCSQCPLCVSIYEKEKGGAVGVHCAEPAMGSLAETNRRHLEARSLLSCPWFSSAPLQFNSSLF